MAATPGEALIIAARRTALGRVGGLHRHRRIEELAVPVVAALFRDAGVDAARADSLVLGTSLHAGNPARLIALASGLSDTASAVSIDRDTASGLDAILLAASEVTAGRSEIAVAGGADSISTAPWRIARPKSLYQSPHFLPLEAAAEQCQADPLNLEDLEAFAAAQRIDRALQDQWAHAAFARAEMARESRRLVGEIVPLRATTDEARDESAISLTKREIAEMPHLLPPDGIATRVALAAAHDGAAAALVVSDGVWRELGRPPALRVVGQAAAGTAPDDEIMAAARALARLRRHLDLVSASGLGVVELAERSSVEEIAFAASHEIDPAALNLAGGAVARGHAVAATGAVLVARLFTELVRHGEPGRKRGTAALAAAGGLGVAAIFEVVR
jgi:acetyl-CoA C-acetyltransferase